LEDLSRLADLLGDLLLFFLYIIDVALQIRNDALELLRKDLLLLKLTLENDLALAELVAVKFELSYLLLCVSL
jgi:hypothetical protein